MKRKTLLLFMLSTGFIAPAIAAEGDDANGLNVPPLNLPQLPAPASEAQLSVPMVNVAEAGLPPAQPAWDPESGHPPPDYDEHTAAFEKMLRNTFPLTEQQILQLRRELDKTQHAATIQPKRPPKPVSTSMQVSLEPGITPPVVRLGAGFVSSLVFLDSTGAPWPIVSYTIGDPETFNIQWDNRSNLMMVQAKKTYANGNMAVKLFGLATPVVLSLVTGQHEVDYRADIQILDMGPNAAPEIVVDTLPNGTNPALASLLIGVPPKNSKRLAVDGDDGGRAWLTSDKKLFYRTKLTVLSPAWQSTMSSADGTRVYQLERAPLLLASRDGKTVKIKISGF